LPSANKKWSQVKTTVKLYLKSVLQVLRKLSDPSILCVVLRHTHVLCPYYASFPKLTRAFIKRMVRMWSSGEEHVRVMAFVGLTKLLRLISTTLVDFAIKQLYTNFVKNCKFTSVATLPLIVFMQNSLVEIFSYNPNSTYQQGFVYIRQLAIHLRNAMVQRKKDSFQSVYNWQFIHCLCLWSRVLSEIPNKDVLQPLVYPLVQVTLGVIRLNPTSRYYPLRFHCIRSLNLLSQATDMFIPVAPFLLEILDGAEFNKPSKLSTAKPTSFSCILKVSKQQLHTKAFQDSVVDEVVELLLEHFSTHAHSIGFPELAFPCVVKMKHFVKTSKVPRLGKQIKQLIEKLNETSQEVTKRRSTVSFSPKDVQEVEKWEAEYRKKPNAIVQFYNRWKSMKVSLPQQDEKPHENKDSESDNEEMKSPKKRSKTGTKTSKKKRHDVEAKHKHSMKAEQADREETEANDVDDIVEDFQFSDLDE
ncbi:nucleolar complex 2 homolog, partial [Paramuricea clavata]